MMTPRLALLFALATTPAAATSQCPDPGCEAIPPLTSDKDCPCPGPGCPAGGWDDTPHTNPEMARCYKKAVDSAHTSSLPDVCLRSSAEKKEDEERRKEMSSETLPNPVVYRQIKLRQSRRITTMVQSQNEFFQNCVTKWDKCSCHWEVFQNSLAIACTNDDQLVRKINFNLLLKEQAFIMSEVNGKPAWLDVCMIRAGWDSAWMDREVDLHAASWILNSEIARLKYEKESAKKLRDIGNSLGKRKEINE